WQMAEAGRTVRVSGLPTNIEDNRLKDKLFIHFLRARNGGGEIQSVSFVKATPISALITFEDSGVAQRVIQHSRHILEVDEKKYKVVVTQDHGHLDPDEVVIKLSATVNYSQLPGGIKALTSIHYSHPNIQINYKSTEESCTLHGAYSKVQAALAQLLNHPGQQLAEKKHIDQSTSSGSRSVQKAQKPHSPESEDQSRNSIKQREQREKVPIGRPFDEYNGDSYRDLTPGGCGWEDTGQTEGAALQLPGHPTTSEDDFPLILDADMFQYLQNHCRKEYQHILSQYGVNVVDMTNQGLTTLFLQIATGVGENGQDEERLELARKAISKLYQENETKICRAQLYKSILSPEGGVQRAMESLRVRFPKLLLNEDERYIYIIGSSSDVSEAKQFLLLDLSKERHKKEDVGSLLRFPSYDSGSVTHVGEQRVPLTSSYTAKSVDDGADQLPKSEEDEVRADGARKYKLAARFKDSGLTALSSRPSDFTLRGLSSASKQHGRMLGHDVLSETASERVSRGLSQNTGEDILFKSRDALSSTASVQSKPPLNSHLVEMQPKSSTSLLSANLSTLLESTSLPPAGSGTPLKRASSFSGTPQQKAEVMGQKSQDDSDKSKVRARGKSSSFSNQTGRDKREVSSAEFKVLSVMWQYIKEVYSTQVDDLTSDVQMKQSQSEGSSDLTITIRGASSSKVRSCQLGLQKLVDSVNVDFSVHEIRLSELGITDKADETLQACRAEVQSRFKKVKVMILKKSVYLLGPNQLCSQVGVSLREVFSGDSAQIPEQQDSSPSTTHYNPSTFTTNENQSTSPYFSSNPQVMPESQTSNGDGSGSHQERRMNRRSDSRETELVNGSISQPSLKKDPVIKEKVRIIGTVEMDGQRTEAFVSHSKTRHDRSTRHVNGVGSTMAVTDKDMELQKKGRALERDRMQQGQAEIKDTPEESSPGPGSICVCGKSEESMTTTKCGVTMCAKCLDSVHVYCKVCRETEPTPHGIQGKMTFSKLYIAIPGYKDSGIKITYCIPDGIQEEGHPSPGKPFRGGVFEAFFPDCKKTWELLPRLKKAFEQGLTFTVTGKETGARVMWDCIPHKTSINGGKTGNGYPDSSYLHRLSQVLTAKGIEEPPAKS
ncbi:hypothetical protein L3Q82_014010, partial [Scortum barcoo]